MTILDVIWTPKVNMLKISCECGRTFMYPSNYVLCKCPNCGNINVMESSFADMYNPQHVKIREAWF